MSNRRITYKDIARRAGVTAASVCLALQNSQRVSERTRSRIHALAKEMGYRPNPELSALVAYRLRSRPAGFRSVIALAGEREAYGKQNLRLMKARAGELGYQVEFMPVEEPMSDWPKVLKVLSARGVRLIVLMPRQKYDEAFPCADLQNFALATVGYSVQLSGITRISTHQYRDMLRHVQHLWAMGYYRPGLWVPPGADARVEHQFSAGYLAAWRAQSKNAPAVFTDEKASQKRLRTWIKEEQIDCVIGLPAHLALLREARFAIPTRLGFSTYDWNGGPEVTAMAGMDYRPGFLLAEAVNALHSAHLSNRRGQDVDASTVLHDARFHRGPTLAADN